MEKVVLAIDGDADRVVAAALSDLDPVLSQLQGRVLLVGGLMQRIWLHLRPVTGIAPRATADVDLGIDKKGLRLTADSQRIGPLLEERGYEARPGEDGFRFEKRLQHGSILVDLLIAKGASRSEPPILEKGIETIAAPGLAYALSRPSVLVEVTFADGDDLTVVELPMPTLDAAFVLKAALVGVRRRPDRLERDTVDALMLAGACASDADAVEALSEARSKSKEVRRSLALLDNGFDSPERAQARRVIGYLKRERGIESGYAGDWVVGVARSLSTKVGSR